MTNPIVGLGRCNLRSRRRRGIDDRDVVLLRVAGVSLCSSGVENDLERFSAHGNRANAVGIIIDGRNRAVSAGYIDHGPVWTYSWYLRTTAHRQLEQQLIGRKRKHLEVVMFIGYIERTPIWRDDDSERAVKCVYEGRDLMRRGVNDSDGEASLNGDIYILAVGTNANATQTGPGSGNWYGLDDRTTGIGHNFCLGNRRYGESDQEND